MKPQTSLSIAPLKLFIQPAILQQIGYARIAAFLDSFADELKAANLTVPPSEPATPPYFSEIAEFLAHAENLPQRLRNAMLTLESAAAPENDALLDAAIQRRIPNVSVSQTCPLDRALE